MKTTKKLCNVKIQERNGASKKPLQQMECLLLTFRSSLSYKNGNHRMNVMCGYAGIVRWFYNVILPPYQEIVKCCKVGFLSNLKHGDPWPHDSRSHFEPPHGPSAFIEAPVTLCLKLSLGLKSSMLVHSPARCRWLVLNIGTSINYELTPHLWTLDHQPYQPLFS